MMPDAVIKYASDPRLDADHPEYGVLIPCRNTAALTIARDKGMREFALSVSSDQGSVGEVIARLEIRRA
jgi:hypothetical protein